MATPRLQYEPVRRTEGVAFAYSSKKSEIKRGGGHPSLQYEPVKRTEGVRLRAFLRKSEINRGVATEGHPYNVEHIRSFLLPKLSLKPSFYLRPLCVNDAKAD